MVVRITKQLRALRELNAEKGLSRKQTISSKTIAASLDDELDKVMEMAQAFGPVWAAWCCSGELPSAARNATCTALCQDAKTAQTKQLEKAVSAAAGGGRGGVDAEYEVDLAFLCDHGAGARFECYEAPALPCAPLILNEDVNLAPSRRERL